MDQNNRDAEESLQVAFSHAQLMKYKKARVSAVANK